MQLKKYNDLVGKTISSVVRLKCKDYDDEPLIRFNFSDGTYCVIEAAYGGYSGGSID